MLKTVHKYQIRRIEEPKHGIIHRKSKGVSVMKVMKQAFITELIKNGYVLEKKSCIICKYWNDMIEIPFKSGLLRYKARVVFVEQPITTEDITVILHKLYLEQRKTKHKMIYLVVGQCAEEFSKEDFNYYNDEVHSFVHFELFHPSSRKIRMDEGFSYFGSKSVKLLMKSIEKIFIQLENQQENPK
jgi:hypothetical protein